MKKSVKLVGLFFLLLFFGLFLGDGKQWAVEVYGAAVVVIVWLYATFVGISLNKRFSKDLIVAWGATFVAVALSAMFSESLGYSISWVVRLACGYLIYRVFYAISSDEVEKTFAKGLVFFVGAAIAGFFIASSLPSGRYLPSMNLLTINYGHSHLADLLVFVGPLLFVYLIHKTTLTRVVTVFSYVFLLYLTRARGAMLLMMVYVLALGLGFVRLRLHRNYSTIFMVLSIAACIYIGLVVVSSTTHGAAISRFVKRDAVTNRLTYWQQASSAFLNKPLLGGGPGTFSLLSLQNQRSLGVSSWFAHSAPLQVAAEMGLVGLLSFGWLIYVHMRKEWQGGFHLNEIRGGLIMSVFVLFVYSCFEFVLDYFITWVLFWAMLGLLVGSNDQKISQKQSKESVFMLAVLGVFYFLWVSSFFVTLTTKRTDIAFYLAPFDSMQALMFLESPSFRRPSDRDVQMISLFHGKNSGILFAISKLKESQGDRNAALLYAKKAAYASPQNSEYYQRYFLLLANTGATELLGSEIFALSKKALPPALHEQIDNLSPYAKGVGEYYKNWVIPESMTYTNGYASLYYRLGIGDLRDVEPTEKLLLLAKDIYPDLAYFHVELAAFYEHLRGDSQKAKRVLFECQKYVSAARQCREQLSFPLYFPSEYKDKITQNR